MLVMAGDIYVGRREDFRPIIERVTRSFEIVIYVPGNHEFYNGDTNSKISMERIGEYMQGECDRLPNVTMLQNRTAIIRGVMFAGGTAWTNIPMALWSYTDLMRDYITIRTNREWLLRDSEEYTPEYACRLHRGFKTWLRDILDSRRASKMTDPNGTRTVVVTHHAPSFLYKGTWGRSDGFIPFYYSSDMDELLAPPVDVWVHGHTHANIDEITQSGTRIVANAIGYKYPTPDVVSYYNPNFVVKI
jgi:hypothetical protein